MFLLFGVHTGDTIAAAASGWARSERAIVRLSGPQVPAVLAGAFEPAVAMPGRPSVAAARLRLPAASGLTPGALSLPMLVLVYPAPRSYTGEHAAELLLPGNPALVERVLALLTSLPMVREATPGEFSARAYFGGKLSLVQAEGVAATIAARTEAELAAARRVLDGESGRQFRAWSDELSTLLALVEAGIDFTDQEDVVPIAPATLSRRLGALADELESHVGSRRGSERADRLPTVVLAGRPNAGKSTLFNALLGRRRAVVSPLAGTTRDVLAEELNLGPEALGAGRVRLVDLAGLDADAGERGEIDARAQRLAAETVGAADVVVHCDPAGRFTLDLHGGTARPVIRVRTMADLPPATDGGAGGAGAAAMLPVCALDGWNLGSLRQAIADAAWNGGGDVGGEGGFLVPRHRRVIAQARERLGDAIRRVGESETARTLKSPELVAGSLREAMDLLGELTGRVTPDDVIGRIFATFCVGK